jgi:uncharacterized protein (TIGR02996 family)
LDSYFDKGRPSPFVAPGSNCWRGYVGTWEIRDDALHLVAIEGTGKGWMRIGLDELFPEHPGTVEATWFSGEIVSDGQSQLFFWLALVVYRGKLLLEETIDLTSGVSQTRLTKHVEGLFPSEEIAFLHAIHANADNSTQKLVYADWLEERGDPRSDLMRTGVEQLKKDGPVRRWGEQMHRQDIPSGYIPSENIKWYWQRLAAIPAMSPELMASLYAKGLGKHSLCPHCYAVLSRCNAPVSGWFCDRCGIISDAEAL